MLTFSEASNLAIHALAYLGAAGPGARLTATDVARKLQRSESHTAKVLNRLATQGLLESSRGAAGGYWLKRDPAAISVREVIEAIDGPLHAPQCLLGQPICDAKSCVFRNLFGPIWNEIADHLSSTKLSSFNIKV